MPYFGQINDVDTAIVDGTIQNKELVNSTITLSGIGISLGDSIAQPAFDLTLATNLKSAALDNNTVNYGGVTLSLGGTDATPAFDLTNAVNYPTTSLTGTITNAQLAGSISNDKLVNSSVSFGGVTLSLGGIDATPAFVLSSATDYSANALTGPTLNSAVTASSLTSVGTLTSLEVAGQGSFGGTFHSYLYANSTLGLTVKGSESGIDIVGNDGGAHGSSLLLRNGTDGFGFLNSPFNDHFYFRSFTSSANNFDISGGGSQLSALVNILTITKSGDVGIGLANNVDPVTKLDVVGNVFVDGSIGIGTTNPTTPLHIVSQSTGFKVQRDNKTFTINANYASQNLCAFEFTDALGFFPGGSTEKVRITSTGSIGIGSTQPTAKLDVDGQANFSGAVVVNRPGTFVAFEAQSNGNINAKVNSDGSAIFSDTVNFNTASDYAITAYSNGDSLSNKATIYARNNTTGGRVWAGDNTAGATTSEIFENGSANFSGPVTATSFNGTPDSSLTINNQSSSYVLVSGDSSKLIRQTGSGTNITVPASTFTAGKVVSIFNASAGNITIVQAVGVTMYNTADGSTGNRTLGAKGLCTIICTNTDEFTISGGGLV